MTKRMVDRAKHPGLKPGANPDEIPSGLNKVPFPACAAVGKRFSLGEASVRLAPGFNPGSASRATQPKQGESAIETQTRRATHGGANRGGGKEKDRRANAGLSHRSFVVRLKQYQP
jgi:hypothetical protein